MHTSAFFVLSLVCFASAQTISAPSTSATSVSSSKSDCDAQNIVDACVAQYQPQLDDCPTQDYECMCQQATNLLSCYNNCPKATDKGGADSKKASWCDAWTRSPEYTKRANDTQAVNTATASSTTSDSTATVSSTPSATATTTGDSAGMHVSPATSFVAFAGVLAIAGLFV